MTALSVQHGKVLDLTSMAQTSDAEYAAMKPFLWGGRHPLAGRAMRLVPVTPPPVMADPAFPLRLNTGRYRDQWHTMTRTGLSPTLSQHRREPLLEVHPADARTCDLSDGGYARVITFAGAAVFRVQVTDSQRPGDLFVPMHWTDAMAGEGRANLLPLQHADPVSGQPGFKNTPARVEPVAADWNGFLVTRKALAMPAMLWWSRARIAGGWLYELAGAGAIDPGFLLPPGERIEAADMVRGMRRIVVQDRKGALEAAIFVTRNGQLPPREWIAEQLGSGRSLAPPLELLAGRPAAPQPDRGALLCICHGVGESAITEAACAGAATVAAIGEATRAGSNCGSCRPAIARLLEQVLARSMEAAE